jgi:hypothetical protein
MERAVLRASDEGHLEGGLRSIFIATPWHVCCVARETGLRFLGLLLPNARTSGRASTTESGGGLMMALRTLQHFTVPGLPLVKRHLGG